jgi:arsenate reductase (thioredoxin)
MKKILVLCTGNSAAVRLYKGICSILPVRVPKSTALLLTPKGVNPVAIQVMAEDGIDISHHSSNHADEYTGIFVNRSLSAS